MSDLPRLETGLQLGSWELGKRLGAGEFGEVYEGKRLIGGPEGEGPRIAMSADVSFSRMTAAIIVIPLKLLFHWNSLGYFLCFFAWKMSSVGCLFGEAVVGVFSSPPPFFCSLCSSFFLITN